MNDDGGVKWAIVQVDGIGGATTSSTPPVMDQKQCDFTPRVVVARPGEEVSILNSDGILHNVHTRSEKNVEVNKAQPGFVKKMPLSFKRAELVRLKCDVHGWMSGYIMVTDSAHVAVTDDGGSFSLKDVPSGTHELSVWHEKLGQLTQQVTVTDGQETQVTFEFAAK